MPDIYARLGLRPIINARGTHTRLGGTLIRPEVLDAMREAAGAYVVLDELQDKASEVIARATGAQAGIVVGGAEAGLLIGTAAILAGTDPAKIAQLPVTDGMKNEAIMHRAHRNGYDHGVRDPGFPGIRGGQFKASLTRQLTNGYVRTSFKYIDDRNQFILPLPFVNPGQPQYVSGFSDYGAMNTNEGPLAFPRCPTHPC